MATKSKNLIAPESNQESLSNQDSLKQYLDFMVSKVKNKQSQFIFEHGTFWTSQKLPNGIQKGTKQECYRNAFLLATSPKYDDSYIYVEGIAVGIIPTNHAWIIDKNGKVIDNTWDNPQECTYYGVPFDREYLLMATYKRGYYGLIDDWHNHWPLVSGQHGDKTTWMHPKYVDGYKT